MSLLKARYTLDVEQTGQLHFQVTIPEIEHTTKSSAVLDSALYASVHAIKKHLMAHRLVIVFTSKLIADTGHVAISPLADLGISLAGAQRERHLIINLAAPLTRDQVKWLDANAGILFSRYFTQSKIQAEFDEQEER
jgi:hypothetical protein